MVKKQLTYSRFALLAILVTLIWTSFNIRIWKRYEADVRQVILQDVANYYAYLPAAFIHQDLSLKFVDNDTIDYREQSKFWPVPVQDGDGYVLKMSMGLSYLYAPFFGMAHAYALRSDKYEADGFSQPYEFSLVMSAIFYVFWGFVFLQMLLLKYFSELVTTFTLLLVYLGTNLYYYSSTEAVMSHGYLFAMTTIFLFYMVRWLELPKLKYAVAIGFFGGIVALIRPVNVLIFLIPMFYGVDNLLGLKNRFLLVFQHWKHLLGMCAVLLLVATPQLLFWKMNSGDWIYYSYKDEHFFFGNPHVIDGLFSYRKGWLIYTPIMVFSFIGLLTAYRQKQPFVFSIIVFLPVYIYVIFSWWCWWYGGGFGARPMIDIYGLLALPIAAFLHSIRLTKWPLKIFFTILFVLLVTLNLIQTQQKRLNLIHYDSMTKEAYWNNFLELEEEPKYWNLIEAPDYEKAILGEDEYGIEP